jgi:hypothetical protein
VTNRKTGLLILIFFGLLWWFLGASTIHGPFGQGFRATGLAISVLLLAGTLTRPAVLEPLDLRTFLMSVGFEVAGIVLAIFLLRAMHAVGYVFPAAVLVIGVHFVGMSKAAARNDYLILAAVVCALGFCAIFLTPPWRLELCGFGMALALWCYAARWMFQPAPQLAGGNT